MQSPMGQRRARRLPSRPASGCSGPVSLEASSAWRTARIFIRRTWQGVGAAARPRAVCGVSRSVAFLAGSVRAHQKAAD